MPVRIVRLGSPRHRDEGLRIGTVRRPPRGVRKADFDTRDFYDVWYPELAPSAELVAEGRAVEDPRAWAAFVKRFRAEMARPEPGHTLDLLAALSRHAAFSVGCYCEDPSRCHRSVLRELLRERGALLVDDDAQLAG